ncbi:MAG TPA: hypothetical protein VF172_08600 [Nitrososphaera sp.]
MRRDEKGTSNGQRRKNVVLQSLKNWYSQDPLWHQTPEMGVEGLIGTIESKKELRKAIKNEIKKRLELYRRNYRKNGILETGVANA